MGPMQVTKKGATVYLPIDKIVAIEFPDGNADSAVVKMLGGLSYKVDVAAANRLVKALEGTSNKKPLVD